MDNIYPVPPTMFVEKFYQMDPRDEDLLFDGSSLRNGMTVLVEDFAMREDPTFEPEMNGLQREALYRFNRWFTVSHLTVMSDNHLVFMATYLDGSKKKIRISINQGYYVKRTTMPQTENALGSIKMPVVDFLINDSARREEPPQRVDALRSTGYSPFRGEPVPVRHPVAQEVEKNFVRPLNLNDSGTIPRLDPKDNRQADPTWFNRMKAEWDAKRSDEDTAPPVDTEKNGGETASRR